MLRSLADNSRRARAWLPFGLRGRLILVVLVALVPTVMLFLYHMRQMELLMGSTGTMASAAAPSQMAPMAPMSGMTPADQAAPSNAMPGMDATDQTPPMDSMPGMAPMKPETPTVPAAEPAVTSNSAMNYRALIIDLFIVAAFATGSAWLVAEFSVMRWIAVLGRAAEAFGRGQLDFRAEVPPNAAEFAVLARRFNEMASTLAIRHRELQAAKDAADAANAAVRIANEELEHRVAERTQALMAAQAELLSKERLSALGELTATVAHELRNPLSAINNTLFSLREIGKLQAPGIEHPLSRIERSIARCDRIITGLLEYSRDGSDHREACCLDRLLGDLLGKQALPANIALVKNFRAGSALVDIDPERFRRAIGNVIDNAVQALAERLNAQLSIGTVAADNALELRIEDTGPGIPAEVLPRIFEPLFSTKSFGTGLGLPVVKRIIEQHGGTIVIESQIGAGTRAIIRLPLAAAEERAA